MKSMNAAMFYDPMYKNLQAFKQTNERKCLQNYDDMYNLQSNKPTSHTKQVTNIWDMTFNLNFIENKC